MICDGCDRGCHTFCANPKLDSLPNGSWHCATCAPAPARPATPTADGAVAEAGSTTIVVS